MTMTEEEYMDHEGYELLQEWHREQAEGPRPRDALVDRIEALRDSFLLISLTPLWENMNLSHEDKTAEELLEELIEKEIELRIREGILKDVR